MSEQGTQTTVREPKKNRNQEQPVVQEPLPPLYPFPSAHKPPAPLAAPVPLADSEYLSIQKSQTLPSGEIKPGNKAVPATYNASVDRAGIITVAPLNLT